MDIAYRRIRELRIKNNFTQEELAKKCGYSGRSAINRIETGLVDIPQSKIEALAKALNTTPAYLMGWLDEDDEQGNKSEYFLDPEVLALMKELDERPELKVLFDAGRNLEKEDIEAVVRLLEINKKK